MAGKDNVLGAPETVSTLAIPLHLDGDSEFELENVVGKPGFVASLWGEQVEWLQFKVATYVTIIAIRPLHLPSGHSTPPVLLQHTRVNCCGYTIHMHAHAITC